MATASSVQREPSMEEILASIRRIIEDSDGGRRPPGEDEAPAVAAEAVEEAEAAAGAPEVAAFRAQLQEDADDTRPARPVTLADVQAQMATDPIAEQPTQPAATDEAGAQPLRLAEIGSRIFADRAADEPARPQEDRSTAGQAEASFDADETKPASGEAGAAPAARQASRPDDAPTGRAASVLAEEATEEFNSTRQALVSEATSRQVAAAFGELSDAFASRSRKSFDEMAEEMLRPMLQDWLDNNLPTLVERLVREEIERVARGTA